MENPGFSFLVVHGGKGFGDDGVRGGQRGDLVSESSAKCSDVVIAGISFEEGDCLIIIVCIHFVLSGKGVGWSHINSSFYSPNEVEVL